MYGVNIGGINAPASADYSAAAKGIVQGGQNTAGAISFLGGLAAQTYTAVKDVDMEQKFRANKEAFMQTELTQQIVQGKQATQQAIDQRNKLAAVSEIPGFNTVPAIKGQDTVINQFTTATGALEEAFTQKQISLSRYLGNVQTLTRQWIAQFPGRADEIRQQVGQLTGIKNADDFAYQTFLEQQMNMQQQSRALAIEQAKQEKALQVDTAKRLVEYGEYGDELTAFRAVVSGQASNSIIKVQKLKEADAIKKSIDTQMAVKGIDADQMTNLAGVNAFVSASKSIVENDKQFKPIIDKLQTYKDPNGVWDLAKLSAAKDELIPVVAQLKAAVKNSFEASIIDLRARLTAQGAPNVDQYVQRLVKQQDDFIKSLDSTDSMLAINILESLTTSKQTQLKNALDIADINSKVYSTFKGEKYMQMWFDPAQKEVLKQQFPDTYAMISSTTTSITGAANQAQALLGSKAANFISNTEKSITSNGTIPTSNDITEKKVIAETAEFVGRTAIKKLAMGKESATQEDANAISSYTETALKDRGPRALSMLKDDATLKAAINNMPEGIKAAYLTNVNKSINDVLNPQGQLAAADSIIYITKKVANAVDFPKDKNGNPQSLIKMQVNDSGYVVPVLEANPAYVAPKGLLEGTGPQGKPPTSRTGPPSIPVPKGRPSVATIEGNKAMAEATKNFNNVVTIAATASVTERKAMATRFAEAYNTSGEPSATTNTTAPSSNTKLWWKDTK